MKNTNKKGFTIVELVIVIAVIAILAAVLIPTFVGLVNKANMAADQQAVNQMNKALAMTGETIDGLEAAIDALDAQGYNSKKALVPVSKGHIFYWDNVNKKVILVKGEGEEAVTVFPEDITYVAGNCESLESGYKYVDIDATDVKTLEAALVDGNEKITLSANVELKNQVTIPEGAKVTLDLNGKTLTTVQVTGRSKYLDVAGELTIVNGTIEARGVEVLAGGKLVIAENSNVTVSNVDSNGGAALWVYAGGEVEINGGTFTAMNGLSDANYNNIEPGVIYNAGTVTINGGTFKGSSDVYAIVNKADATLTINGGSFEANRGVISADGGTVAINGGKFVVNGEHQEPAHVIYSYDATVEIADAVECINNGTGSKYCVDSEGSGSIKVNGETLTAGQSK